MSNIHTGTCPDAGMVLFSFWNGLEGGDSRMSWCRVGYKNPAFQCRKFLTDRQTDRLSDKETVQDRHGSNPIKISSDL